MCTNEEIICACGAVIYALNQTRKCYGADNFTRQFETFCLDFSESSDDGFNVQEKIMGRLQPVRNSELCTLHETVTFTIYQAACLCSNKSEEQKAEFSRRPRHGNKVGWLVKELHGDCGPSASLGHWICEFYKQPVPYDPRNGGNILMERRSYSFKGGVRCADCHNRRMKKPQKEPRIRQSGYGLPDRETSSMINGFADLHVAQVRKRSDSSESSFKLGDSPFYPNPKRKAEMEEEKKRKKEEERIRNLEHVW